MKNNSDNTPVANRSRTWIGMGITAALIAAVLLFLSHWGYGPMSSYGSWWPMSQGGHGGMMGYGGGWGFGSGMGIAMLLFWGLIVFAIVSLIAGTLSKAQPPNSPAVQPDDVLEILKKRYARGEIDKAEFDAKRRDLDV